MGIEQHKLTLAKSLLTDCIEIVRQKAVRGDSRKNFVFEDEEFLFSYTEFDAHANLPMCRLEIFYRGEKVISSNGHNAWKSDFVLFSPSGSKYLRRLEDFVQRSIGPDF